ncbi:MAG: geranylgeranyl reductase family protein [Candidatus Anstonellales archaeon]
MKGRIGSPRKYDAIIVGGGPAGCSTALYCARKGFNVLLIEKERFPRDKVCGDGLSGKTAGILKELGLWEKVAKLPHGPGNGAILSSPKGVELEVSAPSTGYVCRRLYFDEMLFKEAKKRVEAKEGWRAVDLLWENGKVVGVRASGEGKEENFYADVVVGADGAGSIVASKVGQGRSDPEHSVVAVRCYFDNVKGLRDKIEIHFVDELLPGYFWIFPIGGKKANVGVGMLLKDQRDKKVDLRKALEAVMASPKFKERFAKAKQIGKFEGWGLPLATMPRKRHGNGYLLVGDAGSMIDPFTGEGIGNALLTGKLAAETIAEAKRKGDFSSNSLKVYSELIEEELGEEIRVMHNLQKAGRHKWLLNMVFDKASKNPELKQFITSSIVEQNASEGKKRLLSPEFLLKVLLS